MAPKYPKHIYDPLRMEVAASIVSHEFKKIFPDFTNDEYCKLISQIHGWAIDPKKYSLTQEPRDFWNGVEGIMSGFRLKGVVRFITGENVTWTKEYVEVSKFIFSTDHFHVDGIKIPTLNKSAADVYDWLKENNKIDQAILIVDESFGKGIPRVNDLLYCKKDKDGRYHAFDGNGRVMYALLHNIPTVPAYVGEMHEEDVKNCWIYTMFLLNLSSLFREKLLTLEEYKRILKKLFVISESAIIEYKERSPDDDITKALILE